MSHCADLGLSCSKFAITSGFMLDSNPSHCMFKEKSGIVCAQCLASSSENFKTFKMVLPVLASYTYRRHMEWMLHILKQSGDVDISSRVVASRCLKSSLTRFEFSYELRRHESDYCPILVRQARSLQDLELCFV